MRTSLAPLQSIAEQSYTMSATGASNGTQRCPCILMIASVLLLDAPFAEAQRADDNAITSASDAFGTTVGNETIGLYSTEQARGFNPSVAGNVRMEGLYFDRQGGSNSRLVRGSTIRVGIGAQSYPFAAPTGIADYRLRLPGDDPGMSVVGKYGTYGSHNAEIDAQLPLISNRFSLGLGWEGGYTERRISAGNFSTEIGAVIGRWKVADAAELITFYGRDEVEDQETTPRVYAGGAVLPHRIVDRDVFWGQDWAEFVPRTTNYGTIARTALGSWKLQLGAFRSKNEQFENTVAFLRNVGADGIGDRSFVSIPPVRSASTSGELRLTRTFTEGPRHHTINVAAFGRDVERVFGGSDAVSAGRLLIGTVDPVSQPAFRHGAQGVDDINHLNMGVSYAARWNDVGEVSASLLKANYRRVLTNPDQPAARTSAEPWLYSATISGYTSPKLAIYGSYARGLEDGGVAPVNARNPGESAPSAITEQVDLGVRYAFTSNLKLIAGVFRVTKPLFDLDTADIFREVGDISHEGVELSVAGAVSDSVTVVGGVVLLQARLTGQLVQAGLVGRIPPGADPRGAKLNVQYAPKGWHGLSLDAQISHNGQRYLDSANVAKVEPITTADVGARYRFAIADKPASLRLQVLNATDENRWTMGVARAITPVEQRRFSLEFAIDL